MHQGKYSAHNTRKRGKTNKKIYILLASIVLVLGLSIGMTAAYLMDNSSSVTNTFTPASVKVDVEESFEDNLKKNVYLHNASDVKVFVRATVVEYWMDKNGNIVVNPEGCERSITWGSSTDWTNVDGIYYYKNALDPNNKKGIRDGDDTTDLIVEAVVTKLAEGYTYHLDIYAEAIQAEGMNATSAQEAWAAASGS